MTARQRLGLAIAGVISAVFLASCNGSTTTNGATATAGGTAKASGTATASGSAKPAVCATADDLKASVADLRNVNIRQNGTSAVSAQVTKIQQELEKLKADAHGQYSTQIDALSSALSGLSASLSAAGSHLNSTTMTALASSIGSVVSAGTNLVTAVSNTC